jgi:hypothetical protein
MPFRREFGAALGIIDVLPTAHLRHLRIQTGYRHRRRVSFDVQRPRADISSASTRSGGRPRVSLRFVSLSGKQLQDGLDRSLNAGQAHVSCRCSDRGNVVVQH